MKQKKIAVSICTSDKCFQVVVSFALFCFWLFVFVFVFVRQGLTMSRGCSGTVDQAGRKSTENHLPQPLFPECWD